MFKDKEIFDIVKQNKEAIYPHSSMIDALRDLIENPQDARPVHSSDMDPAGEQENIDNEEILESLDTTELPEEDSEPKNSNSKGSFFRPVVVDEDELMLKYARGLSFEQRIAFDKIVDFCKLVKRSKEGSSVEIHPPQLIVTGNNVITVLKGSQELF